MHLGFTMAKRMPKRRTYSEMMSFGTFEERFRYLKLNGVVGESIFGFHRYVNQSFYSSRRWKSVRSEVILRDDGCDLADPDRPILSRVYIHHINPVSLEQLENEDSCLFDLENLVCVSYDTHLAIHYGDEDLLPQVMFERKPGDTTLW